MSQQSVLFILLAAAVVAFVAGRWRYDLVAVSLLLIAVAAGIVPGREAFSGFGDPAVVTVAAVLVLSRALQWSGAVDRLAETLCQPGASLGRHTATLVALVMVLSAFMNNVGALALLLPLVVQLTRREGLAPSLLLMPLAFASLLGGMVTLVGTPPNIILSDARAQFSGHGFTMFDFAPVGLAVCAAGGIFLYFFGRHLVPQRLASGSEEDLFHMQDYVAEVRVASDSPFAGKSLRDLGWATDAEILVLAVVRGGFPVPAPPSSIIVAPGDVLLVEADPPTLRLLAHVAGLELVGSHHPWPQGLASEQVAVVEVVIGGQSLLLRQTVRSIDLRQQYGLNVLGVARAGQRLVERLGNIRFHAGDVLLLQGPAVNLREVLRSLGCLLLAGPNIRLDPPRGALRALLVFAAAVAVSVVGVVPVQVAFAAAAVAMILVGVLPLREAYASIDWSIIVLLGAMLPVGQAMEATGAVHTLTSALGSLGGQLQPIWLLGGFLTLAMALSNILNNAATAVLLAPVALGLAVELGVSPDPFLMALAVGSTAAFLTPIGHQSNTLVMGPGGYLFGDYWKLGLPLSLLVVLVAVPVILWRWPLQPALP